MKINRSLYMNDMGLPDAGLETRSINTRHSIYSIYKGLPGLLRFIMRNTLISILLILTIDAAIVLMVYGLL